MRACLLTRQPTLSRRLQEVGEYVLDHPQSIALDTLAVIATNAGVPPSTLIRFAREFGFDGFTSMQKLYKTHLHRHYTDYNEQLRASPDALALQPQHRADALLEELIAAQRDSLAKLQTSVSATQLEQAVTLMDEADRLHVCAVRRAFPISVNMAYMLSHLGVDCHMIDGLALMHREQAACLRERDLLVAITFRPYANSVREIIESAHDCGARVLLITDDPDAPSAGRADCVLAVRDAELRQLRSLNASLCLAQTLCTALGYRRQLRTGSLNGVNLST